MVTRLTPLVILIVIEGCMGLALELKEYVIS